MAESMTTTTIMYTPIAMARRAACDDSQSASEAPGQREYERRDESPYRGESEEDEERFKDRH